MALHSLWIDFELSSKKFNGELSSSSSSVFVEWTELELTAEFNAVNWTWIELFELYTALCTVQETKVSLIKQTNAFDYVEHTLIAKSAFDL